jgi:hypothetical protein
MRAQEIVDKFNLKTAKKIDGLDALLWIALNGRNEFCISWNHWLAEVSVTRSGTTSDETLRATFLHAPAGR